MARTMSTSEKRSALISGLKNSGFKPGEATRAVDAIDDIEGRDIRDLMAEALQRAADPDTSPKQAKHAKKERIRARADELNGGGKGGPAMMSKLGNWWSRTLTREQRNLGIVGAVGLVAGGTIAILAGRAGKSSSSSSTATPASPPLSPSQSTTPAGATLTVKTPKGKDGKDVAARLRAQAGTQALVLGYVPNGAQVRVLASADVSGKRWYQVQPPAPLPSGWIHGDLLVQGAA